MRVSVHPEGSQDIPLTIGERHSLSLITAFTCTWDHAQAFLAVRDAKIHVTPADSGTPLFRYEFVHGMNPTSPAAHLHVHAHRDEFLFRLFMGQRGKAAARAKAVMGEVDKANPQLSDVHFPLGGPRMRPSLEDVLQMLKNEFEVDVQPGFQAVLDDSRARWRRRQIAASVRDAPQEAVRVLRAMGYTIASPTDGEPPERTDRLICM